MHSPEPLPLSEIIRGMPTDKSIAAIYQKMNEKNRLEKSLFRMIYIIMTECLLNEIKPSTRFVL
jgi:hypothetical protein